MSSEIHSCVTQGTGHSWWFRLCAALAFSLVFMSSQLAMAQDVERGELIDSAGVAQELDEELDAQLRAAAREREAEAARQLELRLQAIDEMQGSQGIYAPDLQEAYADLGALYLEIEDFDSAIAVYSDALQISRINTGLYSEQQLPIIESLIQSNGSLRNWEQADDLQELRYHISSRLYSLDDLAYLEAAENYGTWKLRVLRENLLDLSYRAYSRSAEDLSDFYERLIADMDMQPDSRPKNMIDIFQGKSEADLVLVRSIASTPYTSFEGTASRFVYQQRCQNVRTTSGQVVRECVNVQVENPRYRQSQVDAKRYAMDRGTRDVEESIDRLKQIYELGDLSREERERLASQIAELETQTYQLLRQSRSRRLF